MNPPLPGPNPCLVDRMPEERQPRYVPPEEDFWKVYDTAEGQDRLMLLACLHLAARKGEIFRLTWSDVDFGNNSVQLTTRKRKDGSLEYNWIPMTSELRKALLWWWENRPIKGKTNVFLCLDDTEFCREYYGKPFLKDSSSCGEFAIEQRSRGSVSTPSDILRRPRFTSWGMRLRLSRPSCDTKVRAQPSGI